MKSSSFLCSGGGVTQFSVFYVKFAFVVWVSKRGKQRMTGMQLDIRACVSYKENCLFEISK